MTALAQSALVRWRPAFGRPTALGALTSIALFSLIGIELAVLVSVWPDTVRQWWTASSTGDFGNFYNDAKNLEVNGLYSPGLSLLMYPLSWLSVHSAYRVYVALGGLALLAVAYLAQRSITLPEARLAMALGIMTVPQLHWALRLGHITAVLALIAVAGFLMLRRRPVIAGLCLALLVLKPQYAAVPALYLLWTRNGQALAAMAAGAFALELAGFAAVGFGEVGPYLASFFDLGADARDNLLPYQQSWQYAWQGFLISAHIEPNPLVAIDLSLLSLGVVVLAWARGTRTAAIAAAAIGMLVVTPYANFYDWGVLVVAAVLLLRAELRPPALIPIIIAVLYAALLASQAATPFPAVDVQVGVIEADGQIAVLPASYVFPTDGVYWVTPLALAAVAALAMGGRRAVAPVAPVGAEAGAGAARSLKPAAWLGAAAVAIPVAYFAAAFVGHAPPFTETYDPFAPSEIRKQVPSDFPLPDDAKLRTAGEGEELPYHLEWTSETPVVEIAARYDELLATDEWELMLAEEEQPSYRIRLARFTPQGFMTHWGKLDVSPSEGGSTIQLDLFVTQLLTVTSAAKSGSP